LTFRLNSRCLNILELLVESERPLAAVEIASQLNISSRMVRTCLAPAEGWLREGQITLRKVPGKGFSLAGSGEARRKLARKLREYEQPLPRFSSSEREQVLLLTLFFADRPLQVKQLQQTLNLSRTTTLHVMDSSEKWLQDYNLELVRRPNYGCMISGDEREWRKAVMNLLQESSDDARLLALFQGMKTVVDISSRAKSGLEDSLKKVWMRLDIPLIKLLVLPIEQDFAGRLSDQAYIKFFIYLAIAVYRNRIGEKINDIPDISRHPDLLQRLSESKNLGARIQARLGIHLSEAEITWLALQIPESSPLLPASTQPTAESNNGSDQSIRKTIDQILVQASLSLHPSLNVDEDLIRNLTLLVQTILDPEQGGQTSKNPLLRDVKSHYPYFYSVARQSSLVLADQIGRELSEMEVGDLAICLIASMERLRLLDKVTKKVLVVCSAGVVTAWLLVSRLRAEFPDVEVVEAISALELENRKRFEGIDFIVSTIPLKIKDIPSRQVNPLLGVEDIKRLKDLFKIKDNLVFETRSSHPAPVHLSDLIVSDTIELGVEANTWQAVVEKAGSRLLEVNAIDMQFIQAMKKIILEFGPYMVIWPGAVLLHAPPHGVRRLCMGLINLKEPVLFGHLENDPVKVAVVLGAMDTRSHITALLELNQLMQDENARSAIGNTLHKSVILHWVSRYSKSANM
jgi:transcriptional antiterminator/mannitol/fructose-specific phosphotransferase system IIA component (Ntr-type)